ncbi:MAG: helix-turn-helix transcriptional regulator [Chloroflexi bacterium]|nr:helix-turn-helix transcriptional regulator [Chloroflexota bacterium]
MTTRGYGQFCGLARALEMVGERWALLIVRDLLVGPRRFTDLRQGLPRIPTNVLSERLKQLEQTGVVQRRVLPRPAASVVYELTPYGSQLEDVVMRLGVWGAQSLDQPRDGEIVTTDSMIMALRSTFVPAAARGQHVAYELHLGPIVVHARVEDGIIHAGAGELADADLVIDSGPAIKDLLAGDIGPHEAIAQGLVQLRGDPSLLYTFAQMFHIPRFPASAA